MNKLAETVMQYNIYPKQPWEGWEYVPSTKQDIQRFCNIMNFDWWEGVDWCCLQAEADFSRMVVAVDNYVWEIDEKEFNRILEELIKK